MVQVRVVGVAFDPRSQPLILLKPVDEPLGEGKMLPIWIGPQEATSIVIAVEGAEAPRPLAHDLMKSLLETLGGEVERVEVTRLEEGTFYAEVTVDTRTGRRVLDARPSDAIALASRTGASIWVADDVLDEAGIPDESQSAPADDDESVEEFKRFLEEVDPEDFQG
ncbi:bifunctional nuclease family protein [Herbiconiux sp. SYSU D00978]|uniref:bifunctional nuclease family protein n=1 Tax=Herbiconiux sp. SYSU D00978 TaxID=2812562 RepID=UPI001A96CFDF|nr:bifunctional nuclease family protein [Herbiconiux sp. SYSU D00978]